MKHDELKDIVPTERETECGVHEASRIPRETLFVREVRTHFAERDHDQVTDDSHKAVAQEDTKRTAANESCSRPNDQTCSDRTAKLVSSRWYTPSMRHRVKHSPQSWKSDGRTSLCAETSSPPGQ